MVVRAMESGDIEAVVGLLGVLFRQEVEFDVDPELQRGALVALLDDPARGQTLVAIDGEHVVGTVGLLRGLSTALGRDVCWLEDFVVDPEYRGRGIGSALLDAAITTASRNGWGRITLLTDAVNADAQRLYIAHGFERSSMIVLRRALPLA